MSETTELSRLLHPGGTLYVTWGPWAKPHATRHCQGWTLTLGRIAFGWLRFDVDCYFHASIERIAALTKTLAVLGPQRDDLLDTLQDFVSLACQEPDGLLRSNANSTQADGLRTLAAAGRAEIVQERGRCVVARWKEREG